MEAVPQTRVVRPVDPPDGGYGWFVLLSAFFVFGLTFGVIKSFGVFYVEIQKYFSTTATSTSWITSIAVATVHIAAPLGAALSVRFGHRAVVTAGGALAALGMIAGAFAQDLVHLYGAVGFLSGFGYALTWTPTVTMLGRYFERRRPMANGLASAGECVVTFLISPLFQLLVDCYTWRGAMLILGGIELNLCICGALLRPIHLRQDDPEETVELEELPHVLTGELPKTFQFENTCLFMICLLASYAVTRAWQLMRYTAKTKTKCSFASLPLHSAISLSVICHACLIKAPLSQFSV